ncbi:PAS domain-containing protein [Thiovibrio sp. JS02]
MQPPSGPPSAPDVFHKLYASLADNICCGLLAVEILRDGKNAVRGFKGAIVNKPFCDLLGLNHADIDGKELPRDFAHALPLSELLREAAATGSQKVFKGYHLGKDRYYDIQVYSPTPGFCAVIIKDASKNGGAEGPENDFCSHGSILTQAEEVLASLGDPFCIVDEKLVIRYENETARKFWGDNAGKTCYSAYQFQNKRCDDCHAAKVFADGKIHSAEKIMLTEHGEKHVEITAAPLRDSSGKVIAVVEIARDMTLRKMAEKGKDRLIQELQSALAKVKRLSGLLPICSYCKKIRDDKGYWNQLESYIRSHAEVEFSHSICEECAKDHHPGFFKKK